MLTNQNVAPGRSGELIFYMAKTCTVSPLKRRSQSGVALMIVLVVLLLASSIGLWSFRSSYFNELITGNEVDYQRAFEAAQALIQDAEHDIRGIGPDGSPCTGGGEVCRSAINYKIPLEDSEVMPLLVALDTERSKCRHALCLKRTGRQDFWNYFSLSDRPPDLKEGEVPLEELMVNGVGARFGQYTGARIGTSGAPGNPILSDRSAPTRGGWYWIEVLPYVSAKGTDRLIIDSASNHLPLDLSPNIIFRITAVAFGLRPNTTVVLQQTLAVKKGQ